MYERFTDRVCEAIEFADQEAKRRHHKSIGTEHLLLGLMQVETSLATSLLESLGVSRDQIVEEMDRTLPPGAAMEATAKRSWTTQARLILERATIEARALNCSHVGTEHLLLGLLGSQDDAATQALARVGANRNIVLVVRSFLESLQSTGQATFPAVKSWTETVETSRDAVDTEISSWPEPENHGSRIVMAIGIVFGIAGAVRLLMR